VVWPEFQQGEVSDFSGAVLEFRRVGSRVLHEMRVSENGRRSVDFWLGEAGFAVWGVGLLLVPDGKRFLFSGNEAGRGVRLYVEDIEGGKPRAITPEGTNALAFSLSPDGKFVAAVGPDQKGYLYPVEAGEPRAIPGFQAGELPIGWSADGRSLFAHKTAELPAKIYRLELTTGQTTLWKQVRPADPAGVEFIGPILLTPDGKTYVYGYRRLLSDLYLVEGLR